MAHLVEVGGDAELRAALEAPGLENDGDELHAAAGVERVFLARHIWGDRHTWEDFMAPDCW